LKRLQQKIVNTKTTFMPAKQSTVNDAVAKVLKNRALLELLGRLKRLASQQKRNNQIPEKEKIISLQQPWPQGTCAGSPT